MSDYRGYSNKIVNANANADMDSAGVKLGRFCIKYDRRVSDVSERFNVSKLTIYKWFDGSWVPNKRHTELILDFLEREYEKV
jgi:hypothetical protein|tara:strand:+ start:4704 stop:4949 length:246 start_codon:yes stop_codon:yes gene_type:complete